MSEQKESDMQRDPQTEENSIMKIIKIQEQNNIEILKESNGVPGAQIAEAKARVRECKEFNEEIDKEVIGILKRQTEMKDKFGRRVKSENNQRGYLTH